MDEIPFATLRFSVCATCRKRYHFCFKNMLQIDFGPIACAGGSQKYQYSIGSSIGSGRARPEIAESRNIHIHCHILRVWGVGNREDSGNVEMVTF